MRRGAALPLGLLLLAALAQADDTHAPVRISVDALRFAFYQYDPGLPLNAEATALPETDSRLAALRQRFAVRYDSIHDQRVTAILSVPAQFDPPHPAVLLLAGSGGHKDSDYVRIAADLLCGLGFATLSLDAQYHGDRARAGRTGDFHFIDSATNRDAWIQTVVDLRRGIDFLGSRKDMDASRVGYLGFSQGGMVGGTLLGVEPRIRAALLAVPGGGLLEWGRRLGRWKEGQLKAAAVNAAVIDPIHFIGRFAGRPLLICAARHDELIPRHATEALYAAAGEPKELKWYDSRHALNPFQFIPDLRAFFVKHLGARKPRGQSAAG